MRDNIQLDQSLPFLLTRSEKKVENHEATLYFLRKISSEIIPCYVRLLVHQPVSFNIFGDIFMKSCLRIHALTFLVIGGLSIFTSRIIASTQSAWNDHNKMVIASCIKASNLKAATPILSRPMEFSNEVGYTALLLRGFYPQPHMENKTGSELCLFNKKTKKAYISEIDGYQ
ncbi:hypothetical protein [Aeromonas salmonicida]